MSTRRTITVTGAIAALTLTAAGSALAARPAVTIRVEGLKRTLLPATVVRAGSGSITKGGAPAGGCPASSAAGALNVATHHRWTGTYSSGLGIEVTGILGETHIYSSKGYYWGIWVDNRFASAGICDLTLHPGEQLLFAPAPATGTVSPTAVLAPARATTGTAFRVRVVRYNAGGHPKPLAGVTLTDASGATNRNGVTEVTATHAGKLTLTASARGDIRSSATVTVTG